MKNIENGFLVIKSRLLGRIVATYKKNNVEKKVEFYDDEEVKLFAMIENLKIIK